MRGADKEDRVAGREVQMTSIQTIVVEPGTPELAICARAALRIFVRHAKKRVLQQYLPKSGSHR